MKRFKIIKVKWINNHITFYTRKLINDSHQQANMALNITCIEWKRFFCVRMHNWAWNHTNKSLCKLLDVDASNTYLSHCIKGHEPGVHVCLRPFLWPLIHYIHIPYQLSIMLLFSCSFFYILPSKQDNN